MTRRDPVLTGSSTGGFPAMPAGEETDLPFEDLASAVASGAVKASELAPASNAPVDERLRAITAVQNRVPRGLFSGMIDEVSADDDPVEVFDSDDEGLDAVLDFIHRARGFDFTGYKRSSVSRRIRRRMDLVGVESFTAYLDHLEVHPDEFPHLFNTLLINVTSFFRDPTAWHALAIRFRTVVDLDGELPIRVWSAGCSSGEEAYSVAIMIAEALGTEAFCRRVKIYATDVDEDALAHARHGTFSQKTVESIQPPLVEKYFTRSGAQFTFQKELRQALIFGRHDLVHDAPIPKVDVLLCRNALMYFNAETQTRILRRLQFALNPGGILFLGKAEMLLTHPDMFSPIDLKLRIFGRVPKPPRKERGIAEGSAPPPSMAEEARARFWSAAFDAGPVAQVVVDVDGRLILANSRAAQSFGLDKGDIGRSFHELELSYRPAELRSCIDKVRLERRPHQLKGVERVVTGGDRIFLDIDLTPLLSSSGVFIGTQVSFSDVTQARSFQRELRRTTSELAAAQEELQSASEELETTNEELQSTIEELDATNEELKSTNEELQTINEELQSTNEELQTINQELRQRGTELNEMNAFHSAVLGSFRSGVAVLDRELRIRTWNSQMETLWGARADEVEGKHFLTLDLGVPIDGMTPALRACLATGEEGEQTMECTNRRGMAVKCKISFVALRSEVDRGVILTVEGVR